LTEKFGSIFDVNTIIIELRLCCLFSRPVLAFIVGLWHYSPRTTARATKWFQAKRL